MLDEGVPLRGEKKERYLLEEGCVVSVFLRMKGDDNDDVLKIITDQGTL